MMLSGVGFCFLLFLSFGHGDYSSYSRNIFINPGDRVTVESVNYPRHVPPNLRQTWIFRTEPGGYIKFSCSNIRLLQNKPCLNDALIVSESGKLEEICGARFDYIRDSIDNRLAVSLRTGPRGLGMVQCTAKAEWLSPQEETTTENKFAFLDFTSAELDSSEHGGPKGRKTTTCNCGWANKKLGRIFGGKETHINEFPFVAGLLQTGNIRTFCGATILTPYHALTAAHCLYGLEKLAPFSIVVGEHDIQLDAETGVTEYIPVKNYILHENYNSKKYTNDIALLILEKRIKFSKWVGPACMPTGPIPLENEYIKIIGWGRTPKNPEGSPVLQKVNLRVLSKSSCAALRPGFIPAGSPNQLCTYGQAKSACSGDSGGPLVWVDPETNRYTLIGVVSFGRKDCSVPFPRVATDVTTYVDWIQQKIRENGPTESTCSKV